jgi:hypothetical protein
MGSFFLHFVWMLLGCCLHSYNVFYLMLTLMDIGKLILLQLLHRYILWAPVIDGKRQGVSG